MVGCQSNPVAPQEKLKLAVVNGGDRMNEASRLAEELGLPLVPRRLAGDFHITLALTDRGPALTDQRSPKLRPFVLEARDLLRAYPGRDLLAQALGKKRGTLIDATAGFGNDAVHCAKLGFVVTAVERSPLVHAMFREVLQQLEPAIDGRLRLMRGDFVELVAKGELSADVVYLDPMFPERRRASALPRKELRLLRELVGDQDNVDILWEAAMRCARRRVIVKRPRHAQILGQNRVASFSGRSTRFDLYVPHEA